MLIGWPQTDRPLRRHGPQAPSPPCGVWRPLSLAAFKYGGSVTPSCVTPFFTPLRRGCFRSRQRACHSAFAARAFLYLSGFLEALEDSAVPRRSPASGVEAVRL